MSSELWSAMPKLCLGMPPSRYTRNVRNPYGTAVIRMHKTMNRIALRMTMYPVLTAVLSLGCGPIDLNPFGNALLRN